MSAFLPMTSGGRWPAFLPTATSANRRRGYGRRSPEGSKRSHGPAEFCCAITSYVAGDGSCFRARCGGWLRCGLAQSDDNRIERIRSLNDIADDDAARRHLKCDIPRLRQPVKLLHSATYLALLRGLCTALLVVVAFVSALLQLQPIGAPLLFTIALILLGGAIFQFSRGRM